MLVIFITHAERPLFGSPMPSKTTPFAGRERLQEAVSSLLRKYVDKFYAAYQRRWESERMVLRPLTGDHPNFADYKVRVRSSDEERVEQVKSVIAEATRIYNEEVRELPNIHFDRHLYQPLLLKRGEKIKSAPPGLHESEETFIKELRKYCEEQSMDGAGRYKEVRRNVEIFLLRNHEDIGVRFFRSSGFYPDFILWVKQGSTQRIVFVEPHGMFNEDAPETNDKVRLYQALRELEGQFAASREMIVLDSFIVSVTSYGVMKNRWGGDWERDDFFAEYIIFEDELPMRLPAILGGIPDAP
jgi:hypothetical protein